MSRIAASEDQARISATKVLGLAWDKANDTLSCEIPDPPELSEAITKRIILSYINQVFDPIGFLCPALLHLKLVLQETWASRSGWDEELTDEVSTSFKQWMVGIHHLKYIKIDRSVTGGLHPTNSHKELHTFCDASQNAYAAVVYLRTKVTEADGSTKVSVQLLMAKSRLSPLKKPTIPRLELLACAIGARLTSFTRGVLNLNNIHCYLWTDSTTALAWIKRNNEWGTFVGNRVKEICTLTNSEDWRHVAGINNPADLPSRGCTPYELLQSRWWEGPKWLYGPAEKWPAGDLSCDESAILVERRRHSAKTMSANREPAVAVLMNQEAKTDRQWYLLSSSYTRNVRVIAWVKRFAHNAKQPSVKLTGNITIDEFNRSESTLLKLMQLEEFTEKDGNIHGLRVEKSDDGLYHVKTRLTLQHEDEFGFPVLLPSKHRLTEMLIQWYHLENHHAGTQFLMSKIRERFWILQTRRTITRCVHKCVKCLRHSSKSFQAEPSVLPACRTETSNHAFQTTGVDLAGPLLLKNGKKAWLVLFTCAVYRCIHLDFVMSLSTGAFLNALERFINVRGPPSVIYSDNGTNFVGTDNLFKKLNWNTIEVSANIKRIKWIFNPPTAAWWGGWWERLVRTVKDLLKRMLGSSRLNYDQLRTSLSHVENVSNERPLTVVTEDQNDLIPLTPAMFLIGINQASLPEGQLVGSTLSAEYKN